MVMQYLRVLKRATVRVRVRLGGCEFDLQLGQTINDKDGPQCQYAGLTVPVGGKISAFRTAANFSFSR